MIVGCSCFAKMVFSLIRTIRLFQWVYRFWIDDEMALTLLPVNSQQSTVNSQQSPDEVLLVSNFWKNDTGHFRRFMLALLQAHRTFWLSVFHLFWTWNPDRLGIESLVLNELRIYLALATDGVIYWLYPTHTVQLTSLPLTHSRKC